MNKEEIGKSYAKRAKNYLEAQKDFYPTPKGLTIELLKTGVLDDCNLILEPSAGEFAITKVLERYGKTVTSKDIKYGNDFLLDDYTNKHYDAIVTNPPFTLFDEFVMKAKKIDTKKIIFISRPNHFASHKTNLMGVWENLSDVYIFDRQVAYNKPLRNDGKCYCGCLVTGWFIWTKDYKEAPRLHVIDVQDWIARKGEEDV